MRTKDIKSPQYHFILITLQQSEEEFDISYIICVLFFLDKYVFLLSVKLQGRILYIVLLYNCIMYTYLKSMIIERIDIINII